MSTVADTVIASGRVQKGKLFIRHRKSFDDQIKMLDERWELEITVKRQLATRSTQANRYWWGVVLHLISEHTGDTPDDLHDYFKRRFLPKRLALAEGVTDDGVVGGSTRKLTTKEFGEFIDQVKQFASEFLDLYIPDPEDAF